MEEGEALAEHLGLVVGLDPQALPRVQLAEAQFQAGQQVLMHIASYLRSEDQGKLMKVSRVS